MSQIPEKPARYHHFILLLWHDGGQRGWRISLQDPHKGERTGFKNLEELTAFLKGWMKDSSAED